MHSMNVKKSNMKVQMIKMKIMVLNAFPQENQVGLMDKFK